MNDQSLKCMLMSHMRLATGPPSAVRVLKLAVAPVKTSRPRATEAVLSAKRFMNSVCGALSGLI